MPLELTSVADDEVVFHQGAEVHRFDGLTPDTEHTLMGVEVRTLPRPGGELLCRFATVNDVHFGEEVCGIDETFGSEPVFRSEPGETPYPEMMNSGAIAEITAIAPAAVIVKGDLTADGHDEEYAAFRQFYGGAFGDRLHTVRGNHDGYRGQTYAMRRPQRSCCPASACCCSTRSSRFRRPGGSPSDQLAWLDDLAAPSDRPVIVMGHHHPWSPDSSKRSLTYFGINPDDSEGLVDVIARHPSIIGYFAGHTHRNRVRRFSATGDDPVGRGGVREGLPRHVGRVPRVRGRRDASAPAHLDARRARVEREDAQMFAGLYAEYAFGALSDRCFVFGPRRYDRRTARVQRGGGGVCRWRALRARRRLVVARPWASGRSAISSATPAAPSRRSRPTSAPRRLAQLSITSPAEYYRIALGNTTPAFHDAVAERGRQTAAELGADPVSAVRTIADRVLARVSAEPDGAPCGSAAGAMRLIDYLPTRVVELTVHTVDLTDAIGRPATVRLDCCRADD